MDLLALILVVLLVVIFWPVLKAFVWIILIIAAIVFILNRSRRL